MIDKSTCTHNWEPNGIVRTENIRQGTWRESNTDKCTLCGLLRETGYWRQNNWSGD